MENYEDNIKYLKAKKMAKNLKVFYIMLSGYFLLMPFLVFLNLSKTPEFHWFWFPIIGGGLSIIAFAFDIFTFKKWEEKKIRELMDKYK